MKWMIASDIHGSAYYCRKILDAFAQQRADRLILLGDLLYHGPRNDLPAEYDTKAVAGMLNAVKERIFCVRGNCEAEVDQMVLEFPVLADYMLLPLTDRAVFATHGHLHHQGAMPPLMPGDLLLHGHTHIPVCEAAGENFILNPGSVSIPKNGSPHSFLLLEDGMFTWFDLETGRTYGQWQAGTPADGLTWKSAD